MTQLAIRPDISAPADRCAARAPRNPPPEFYDAEAVRRLGPVDRGFLQRVASTDPSVYTGRLQALGFEGLEEVLDAGCGFGQWTACLAELNRSVTAVDCAADRLAVAAELARRCGVRKVRTLCASVAALPFDDDSFDGAFSYSVIYLTDWRRAVAELCRCLRPGGLLYVGSNGLGWYLYNLLEDHNSGSGFSSRRMAIDAFENSLEFYARGTCVDGRCVVTPSRLVCDDLRARGMEILASGPDGSINITGTASPVPFYDPQKYGHESVWEVLCRKPSVRDIRHGES